MNIADDPAVVTGTHRSTGAVCLAALCLSMVACAPAQVSQTGELDPRLTWPCESARLSWSLNAQDLQSVVADPLVVRQSGGLGEVSLHVFRCESLASGRLPDEPLLFAYVTIPISADSAPISVTGIPPDGWQSVQSVLVDDNSSGLFEALGYSVQRSSIAFDTRDVASGVEFEFNLLFDKKNLSFSGRATGDAVAHVSTSALIGRSADYSSAFFGKVTSMRYETANIEARSEVFLSGLTLAGDSASVILEEQSRSDRVYWRIASQ